MPVPHPQEIRVLGVYSCEYSLLNRHEETRDCLTQAPRPLQGTKAAKYRALSQHAFTEHLLCARKVLDAGDIEVRETGPQPTWAWDESTHKCNAARHLPVKVYARHHGSRSLGWNVQGKVKESVMEEVMLNRIIKEE